MHRAIQFLSLSSLFSVIGLAGIALGADPAKSKEQPTEKPKAAPRVVGHAPFGVAAGTTRKITLYGFRLDGVTAVSIAPEQVKAKIVGKGKGPIPDKFDAKKIGDTQVEIEFAVPADAKESFTITLDTGDGKSEPQKIAIDAPGRVILEKEPNGGFRNATSIAIGQVAEGVIERGQDVDTFRVAGPPGKRVRLSVLAEQYGSTLDAAISVYSSSGGILASADDSPNGKDPSIGLNIPPAGEFFVVVYDAHDSGSNRHAFRLVVREE